MGTIRWYMRIGTWRTRELGFPLVAATGIVWGTESGRQLSTTGKLEASGPANRGSGDVACVGVILGTLLGLLLGVLLGLLLGVPLAPAGPEAPPDSAGPEAPALEGTVGREWLLEFESPQAADTRRAAMQTAATAATRLPRVTLHFNAASAPMTGL
jgi:hypothetical protein